MEKQKIRVAAVNKRKKVIQDIIFSPKEYQVGSLYIRGRSVNFISQNLNMSSGSVSETLRRVREKIGASSRDDCIDFAECSGWVSPIEF